MPAMAAAPQLTRRGNIVDSGARLAYVDQNSQDVSGDQDDTLKPSRTEKSCQLPEALRTVGNLQVWLSEVAMVLVLASAYNDKAEVKWWSIVNDP